MVALGVRPHDVRAEQLVAVAPGVDDVEAQRSSDAPPDERRDRPFVGVARMLNRPAAAGGPKVPERKRLIQAGNLAARVALAPAIGAETMPEEDKDPYLLTLRRQRRPRAFFHYLGGPTVVDSSFRSSLHH